ncbi:MAG: DUF177 domain-containing protein [Solirubrobacterales bacterium]|nr:DUF177 domain-containing protein [Solirubrobacterales bacterium]
MAAAQYHTIDLTRLALGSGQGTRLELAVDPGTIALGGSEYSVGGGTVLARIDISRTATGYALRMGYAGALEGPCVRCLEPARLEVEVDAREVDQPSTDDEELTSPYVSDGVIDLSRWAHDALALSLPQQILCRVDCAGLCAICGESLNDAEPGAHDHPREPDPRWAKLRELQ